MLKHLLSAALLATALTGGAQAATVILLPEPGSMQPATVLVDTRSADRGTVLVCASMSQISTGGCSVTSWSKTGLKRP